MSYGQRPFGLRNVRLTNMAGSEQVSLPAAQTLSFNERVKSGELSGDDRTIAVVAFSDAIEWSIEAGGISLEAYALMTGRSVSEDGTTPSQAKTMTGQGGLEVFPYFKIYGKSVGDGTDDVHVKIFKAKLTSIQGQLGDNNFWVTQAGGVAIDDGENGLFDIVQNETAADLPSD